MSQTGRSLNNHLHDIAALRRRVARLELALGLLLVAILGLHMVAKIVGGLI